jgi:hypothetical protein
MSIGGVVLLAIAGVAVYLLLRDKWRQRDVFIVRTRPPVSHTLQNLMVLAALAALGWFIYWVKFSH